MTLDPLSGVLTLGQQLDRESTPFLYLVVRATDQAVDPSQRRWGSVTARLFVKDENDNPPVFSSPSAVSVMEDQPVGYASINDFVCFQSNLSTNVYSCVAENYFAFLICHFA